MFLIRKFRETKWDFLQLSKNQWSNNYNFFFEEGCGPCGYITTLIIDSLDKYFCFLFMYMFDNVFVGSIHSQIQRQHGPKHCNYHLYKLLIIHSKHDLCSAPFTRACRTSNWSEIHWTFYVPNRAKWEFLPSLSSFSTQRKGWEKVQDSKGWSFWLSHMPTLPFWDHRIFGLLFYFSNIPFIFCSYRHNVLLSGKGMCY